MTYKEEGTFFYYLALLIGMVLVGSYLWLIFTTLPTNFTAHFILFMTGVLLVITTLGFSYAETRSGRLGLTMATGILAGVHGFLELVYFPLLEGIILFAWFAFGLLLSLAAYSWLKE